MDFNNKNEMKPDLMLKDEAKDNSLVKSNKSSLM